MTQEEALDILERGESIFLTGAAGSGKTYTLNTFIKSIRTKKVPIGITASTGIAATHMGGITLHSWSGIGISTHLAPEDIDHIVKTMPYKDRLRKTKVLVIDEVSMLHAQQIDMVDEILRGARDPFVPFGGVQIVFCGDFSQLPPVTRRGSAEGPVQFAHEAEAWKKLNPTICYLDEQYRQEDPVLLRLLNDIRNDTVTEKTKIPLRTRWHKPIEGQDPVKLFTHNIDVDALNKRTLDALGEEEVLYVMESSGPRKLVKSLKDGCLAPEELAIKEGAQVMFVKNNFEKGYINGTLGTVIGYDDKNGYPKVKTKEGKVITAEPEKWRLEEREVTQAEITQVPLRLAWAITVHKSQGMSLDAAEIDLSKTFESGMGYVALSRVRRLEGLKLTGMNERAFMMNKRVLELDKELQKASHKAQEKFRNLPKKKKYKNVKTSEEKSYSVNEIRKTVPSAYRPWTEAEEEKLKAGFQQGRKRKQLAQDHERSVGGINARLKKLGLTNG